MKLHLLFMTRIALMVPSCNRGDNGRDASGTFEIRKIIVSSEVIDRIIRFNSDDGELVSPGKAMFKLADLTEMILRAYPNGDQLAQVTLGQEVTVYLDSDASEHKSYKDTLFRILTTLILADSGSATVAGLVKPCHLHGRSNANGLAKKSRFLGYFAPH